MSELKRCGRCGLTIGRMIDIGTGSICHPEPMECIAHLQAALFDAASNRPESQAERVLREYWSSRLVHRNVYSLSANARLRKAIDELNKLASKLAEDKTAKHQGELCSVCGIGSYLPSGRCDHCDSPARKITGEITSISC